MIRAISIIVASFLVLIISGCANTVQKPTVQQHYLVVSMMMNGNIDVVRFRYFVFVKYNASTTVGPDLTNQTNYVLSLPNASAGGIDGISTGNGQGFVISNFQFDEFYEVFGNQNVIAVSAGSWTNVYSTTARAQGVIIVPSANTIQLSIPLNTASSPFGTNIGINLVTASGTNYLIQDYLTSGTSQAGYHLFTNILGNTYSSPVASTSTIAPSADIVSWSASII